MSLDVSADSVSFVQAGATSIRYVHVAGGAVSLISGAAALILRKGSPLHRIAGKLFVVAMLVTAAIGAALSPFLNPPQWGNVTAGLFAMYLVATAWMTANRRCSAGYPEIVALALAAGIALGAIVLGVLAAKNPAGTFITSGAPLFMFATLVSLAALGDLRMILRRRLTRVQCLVRHMWRMCYALASAIVSFISFFLSRSEMVPESIRTSGVIYIPLLAVFVIMIFWFIRLRMTKYGQRLTTSA
jgi:hypothetical protein